MTQQHINLLIPMNGRGNRFKEKNYQTPKPLIKFGGEKEPYKAMWVHAVDSLALSVKYKRNVILVTREEHQIDKNNNQFLNIPINYETCGPAATCLIARHIINCNHPLIIANCDQIMDWNMNDFVDYCLQSTYDGVVVTYDSQKEHNSFAKLNKNRVIEIREKQKISNIALNGIHFWKRGCDFVDSAMEMLIRGEASKNGEFYVSETYNYLINKGKNIGIFHIPKEWHHAVGTPEDLESYKELVGDLF